MSQQSSIAAGGSRVEGELPSLDHATAWLNSKPLNTTELRGKVVLVDFWTYTCINWRRTLPWLRAWSEKYRDHGLVVIGVHTPEFDFEGEIDNVRRAVKEQSIGYPVAIDTQYQVWNAFDNHYWPALYLVDAEGRIRHHQFGEGDYDNIEAVIRKLLTDAGHRLPDVEVGPVIGVGAESEANWSDLKSPETYLGHTRSGNFASPEIEFLARGRDYTIPEHLRLNQWALAGNWTLSQESARSNNAGDRVVFRFHARDVHLVMAPAARATPVRFRVTLDDLPPGPAHGMDVDEQGFGSVDGARMYQLIRQPEKIRDRTIEIEFLDPGAEAFVFTFG